VVVLSLYLGNDIRENQYDLDSLFYSYALDRSYFRLNADGDLVLYNFQDIALTDPDAWLTQLARTAPPAEMPNWNDIFPTYTLNEGGNPIVNQPVDLGLYLDNPSPQWEEAWRLTEALLEALQTQTRQDGVALGVLLIPDRRIVHQEDWEQTVNSYPLLSSADPLDPLVRVHDLLRRLDIPTLDMTLWLQQAATSPPYPRLYFPRDGHFTLVGHRVTADLLTRWLLQTQSFQLRP
jgi:hypothetical protein